MVDRLVFSQWHLCALNTPLKYYAHHKVITFYHRDLAETHYKKEVYEIYTYVIGKNERQRKN